MAQMTETPEQKAERARAAEEDRQRLMKAMGIELKDGDATGITQQKRPHLMNLNEDPLMNELLLYSQRRRR